MGEAEWFFGFAFGRGHWQAYRLNDSSNLFVVGLQPVANRSF